jgi:hypothetical protein
MKTKKPKLYKCREKAKGCFIEGHKWTSNIQMQRCCENPNCVLQRTVKIREASDKKKRSKSKRDLKEFNIANRTIAGWCLDARKDGFNPWVRERDKDDGCIVCGSEIKPSYHAGHFMSVGSRPELQFHPDNCHKQCSGCNCSISSVSKKYRTNLVDKIGLERVEYLENYHATIRWTIEEIKEIKQHYRELIKELKGGLGIERFA